MDGAGRWDAFSVGLIDVAIFCREAARSSFLIKISVRQTAGQGKFRGVGSVGTPEKGKVFQGGKLLAGGICIDVD
jgi:hypothetical protein